MSHASLARRSLFPHAGRFARTLAGSALGVFGMPALVLGRGAGEKLNIALVGVAGRGATITSRSRARTSSPSATWTSNRLGEAAKGHPRAKTYHDFRRMFDELHKQIDAVVVSTPDHTHAVIAKAALELGKHVYCEKPLTHSIHEARVLAETAARHKVATQMGNAGHSSEGTRRVVELIRAGAIGPVREVHAWTNRPIWPQAVDRPADRPPVPKSLHWDLWLGPAPERPYHPAYHPFKWRGWWDFGTGALGDMGCHIIDAAFWALELRDPQRASRPRARPICSHPETAPAWSIVRYEFPARGSRPAGEADLVRRRQAPAARPVRRPHAGQGSQRQHLRGRRRAACWSSASGGGAYRLLPETDFAGFAPPKPTIPRSPGHHAEWIEACKTGKPTGTSFDYSGPLTELVLLGNVALRAGRRIDWDGPP